MRHNPKQRRERIMAAAEIDDWAAAEAEIADAVESGLVRDLANPRIVRTRTKIEADVSDGRTLYFDVRLNLESNLLEAVDALGKCWVSAATIEGLAAGLYGVRLAR